MIVVATADFEVYHDVVNELRERGVRFRTVEPGEDVDDARVVITGPDDDIGAATVANTMANTDEDSDADADRDVDAGGDADADGDGNAGTGAVVDVVRADPDGARRAVEEALALVRGADDGGRTVVGIDPGERPGIAILSGETVVAAFQVPAADVGDVVSREVGDAVDPVVRIGDGARLRGSRLIDALSDVRVELVDETGTTPSLGQGARGMGDVLAAVNIARIEGEPVETRDVEPTAGEIQVIKTRSRERSPENREIDAELARRVALGDLSLEEAMDAHRDGDTGGGGRGSRDSGRGGRDSGRGDGGGGSAGDSRGGGGGRDGSSDRRNEENTS